MIKFKVKVMLAMRNMTQKDLAEKNQLKEEIKSHWHTWVFYLTLGIVFIIVYKFFQQYQIYPFSLLY